MLVTCPHCNQTHENPGIHKLLIKGGLESVTVTPDANNHQVVVGDDQGTAELHLAPVVALSSRANWSPRSRVSSSSRL